jgi:hypothetical protein
LLAHQFWEIQAYKVIRVCKVIDACVIEAIKVIWEIKEIKVRLETKEIKAI